MARFGGIPVEQEVSKPRFGGQPVDQPEQITQEQPEASASDYGLASVAGVNELFPALAGLPVDTMRNIVNLGIAAYGTTRGALTPKEEGYIPPEPLPPMPGGSEWMKRKISGVMGADPFAVPDPTDPVQQRIKMGSSIIASGALAPTTGLKQTASQMAKMVPPAGGAIAAQEAFPEEPLAPMMGMMAVPAGMQAIKAGKAQVAPAVSATKSFIKAHKLGYQIPPALAKPTKTQQFIEGGVAGSAVVRQKAAIHNQKVTNDLIKRDLGYPDDVPLSHEGLQAIRAQAGQAYDKAKVIGTFKTDKAYFKSLDSIAKKGSAMAKEFPDVVRKDVADYIKSFRKDQMSADAVVDVVKQLRSESSSGFRSSDPGVQAMARAQKKLANSLESLMERQAATSHPDLVPALKNARQKIAKTYTIENALKGENVDAVALARQLDKGKPLSGTIKDVAEAGQSFKGAMSIPGPQPTGFRVTDMLTGMGGAAVMGDPAYLALVGARPAVRSLILSKPYQKALAKAKPADLAQIKALPKMAQTAAMAILAEKIQDEQSSR